MRNNKAILDEAARSVRRTFIGSAAGTLGMLAVVGAAGAYGMPERLTAHAFSAALSSLKLSPPVDRTAPPVERTVRVAENVTHSDALPAPAPEPVRPPQGPVVRTMPEISPEPRSAPLPPPAPAAVSHETVLASPAPVEPPKAEAAAAPVKAEASVAPPKAAASVAPPKAAASPTIVEPAPTVTASIAPPKAPDVRKDEPSIPSLLVFEAPVPDKIPPLVQMPKLEPVAVARPEPVQVKAPVAAAVTPAEPAKAITESVKPVATVAAVEPTKPSVAVAAIEPIKAAMAPATMELPKIAPLPPMKPPLSPAQRLDLHGKDYDKAEKCLAQAVYFEARDQAVRGQQAVAQVVLNRVFSPYYPKDICSVVYQNAHRHLSCQFTFACDGKPETIRERGAWARANRIATQSLNAQIWLPEVDKATHYHASYVHPRWVRDMRVMVRYGIHTFYRPRNWGDGANEAHWGTAANSLKPAAATAPTTTASAKHHAPPARKPVYRRTAALR